MARDADQTIKRILDGIGQSEAGRDTKVKEYTRLQHYWAKSSRFGENAEMLVRMHYDRARGKDYVIISRSGSPSVQTRVFEKLLQLELKSASATDRETTLFTSRHYKFQFIGIETMNGKKCYVLDLTPLQADNRLFTGKAWVEATENAVVRVEGQASSNVSFWMGRAHVVQEFGKLGEFWFATKRDSVASSFLLGPCELRIEYSDYNVVAE